MVAAKGDEPFWLHLGGREARPGWTILNAQAAESVDITADILDLDFLEDASCDRIYASHVLEHFSYIGELPTVLASLRRILKPDGLLQISVPNLEILAAAINHAGLDEAARYQVMRMMFGGQTDPYDFHKVGFTPSILTAFLNQAGFSSITRVEKFDIFEDASNLKIGNQLISLNVEVRV